MATVKGVTWKHDRGLAPLLATAKRFAELDPGMRIEREARSLQDFGDSPLERLAEQYDLIVLGHPFMSLCDN